MIKVSFGAIVFFFSLFLVVPANGWYRPDATEVKWLKPSEAAPMVNKAGRPIILDVYTSWCVYCKVMDATTWKNDSVVRYIEQFYYPVKLDAESKDTEAWFGKQYEYLPKFKVNQLAVELLRGNMVYPSTVIIPEKGEWQVLPGAAKPKEIEIVLKYYGTKANEKMDFKQWQQNFSATWK